MSGTSLKLLVAAQNLVRHRCDKEVNSMHMTLESVDDRIYINGPASPGRLPQTLMKTQVSLHPAVDAKILSMSVAMNYSA